MMSNLLSKKNIAEIRKYDNIEFEDTLKEISFISTREFHDLICSDTLPDKLLLDIQLQYHYLNWTISNGIEKWLEIKIDLMYMTGKVFNDVQQTLPALKCQYLTTTLMVVSDKYQRITYKSLLKGTQWLEKLFLEYSLPILLKHQQKYSKTSENIESVGFTHWKTPIPKLATQKQTLGFGIVSILEKM